MTDFKNVLLTGGAGFIGSHVAEALLRAGVRLTIVDNLDHFYSPLRKRTNLEEIRKVHQFLFHEVDICHMDPLRAVVEAVRPAAIIHLAALAGVRPSIEQPLKYEQVNCVGTLNLLELCREIGVQRFIFGSSSSVYGETNRVPFSEDDPTLRPISPYAATKLAGEITCYAYARLFDIQIVCLRFFTVYGPRQRPDLAIHKFTSLLEAGSPIPLFGDGSSGRDYTHVDDIVSGLLKALEYTIPSKQPVPFEIFNLGNSHPVTLNDLILLLEEATGRKCIRSQMAMQPGDVPLTWANISKAEKLFGYRPAVRLEEGLKHFVNWYRKSQRMGV
jgi:UDP-glucuronate 4-epimerase